MGAAFTENAMQSSVDHINKINLKLLVIFFHSLGREFFKMPVFRYYQF